jgi:prephenate dehydratase
MSSKNKIRKIAVLGPANSFSDIASSTFTKAENLKKIFARDIDEVFEFIEKGKADLGLVPLENKINGKIRETVDNLFFRDVHIVKEISIPIIHSIITLEKTAKKDIKRIISHEQALAQCKKHIKKNFPSALLEAFPSTSHAIQKLLETKEKDIAVIASEIIVKGNKLLKILEKGIEDFKDNSTTFVLIEKGKTNL